MAVVTINSAMETRLPKSGALILTLTMKENKELFY